MTEELFREDAYARRCEARVIAVEGAGICLDRTVFYPTGGGQPGDRGRLTLDGGGVLEVVDTVKGGRVSATGWPRPAGRLTKVHGSSPRSTGRAATG